MTTIESNKENIKAKPEDIYKFLSNMNNFTTLMPPQVENWQATEDSCSFRVSGLADIGLRIIEKTPFNKIVVSSDGNVPVNFTMLMHIKSEGEDESVFQIVFLSDMNNFMAMMVTKPLTNFVNVLAQKLKEYFEKQ